MSDEINLRIVGVDPGEEIAGVRPITIRTNRGEIDALLHRADSRRKEPPRSAPSLSSRPGQREKIEEGNPQHSHSDAQRAALCVSGAIGGFDGPAMLYPRLGLDLPRRGISVMRVDYRAPNEFGECVLDAMAALSVLKGLGHRRVALVGHSFGGAVAINAGTLSDAFTTVVAISSQLAGSHVVADLSPRPLLLVHGTADQILAHESSRVIYERAREPKMLKLFDGADHGLRAVANDLWEVVSRWIEEHA